MKSIMTTVLSKREDGHYEGSHKYPEFVSDYYVTLVTEKNKTIELKVTKRFYDRIVVGKTSTLVTQNGEFFDFSDGETKE